MTKITRRIWDGYGLYTMENEELRVCVTELGATITEIAFRGRTVTLGYARAEDYLKGTCYIGATIGRVANRIGKGRFAIDGKAFQLNQNENGNTLHGGKDSFDKRRWDGVNLNGGVRFSLVSPAGDNGFPGTMKTAVTYTLAGSELHMDFEAVSDEDTLFAPTNHSYFNLDGAKDVRSARLQINAKGVVEVDGELIPTGNILPAEGNFDFSELRPIGRDYDHCFCLKGETACVAEAGGVRLTVRTDLPGMQLYTGAFLTEGFTPHQGFALEPSFYPDAPNHPNFLNCVLRAGEKASHSIVYRFEEGDQL